MITTRRVQYINHRDPDLRTDSGDVGEERPDVANNIQGGPAHVDRAALKVPWEILSCQSIS